MCDSINHDVTASELGSGTATTTPMAGDTTAVTEAAASWLSRLGWLDMECIGLGAAIFAAALVLATVSSLAFRRE